MAKCFVQAVAVIFLVYGAMFSLFPAMILQFVVDGSISSSAGLIDVRATYGGMSIGVATMLFMLSKLPDIAVGLKAVLMVMFAMAGTRLIGIMVDGSANSMMYNYLALEILAGVIAAVLLKRLSKL